MPPSRSSSRRARATRLALTLAVGILAAGIASRTSGQAARTGWSVIAWNNLGMHCMDADFSVFSILPPYNTIQAQVVDPDGRVVTDASGVTLTYQAVADAAGSINTTSVGKTNFWTYIYPFFGVSLPPDAGLKSHNMPGASNAAQPMVFDTTFKWYIAEGIPITPYDDAGHKNYYPMMKVTAKDATGTVLASTKIVLPVSDEMDCSMCHSSGSGPAARPAAGWVSDPNPQRDFRLNILRRHDDGKIGTSSYDNALAANGYDPAGLYAAAAGGKPVLCAHCHSSEALPGSGFGSIRPLTAAMHAGHAPVVDPTNDMTLDSATNRSACYRCHPGSETRCLRGVMGNAVAADGSMAIQCQNCHGRMSDVGAPTRTGWFNEPTCQQCHTGTATRNSGAIRFTSVFKAPDQPRTDADIADRTFATSADAPPGSGLSLYRFSAGHGGLQCSACHGSTHAEYPSSHASDNVQSAALQGHVGTIGECSTCHAQLPALTTGGPHGMHPIGASWVTSHHDAVGDRPAQCQACHGMDYRGTVLSRSFAARTLTTSFGAKTMFRGAQVSCYMCHNGPSTSSANPNRAPVVPGLAASVVAGASVPVTLTATDADGNALTYRIVSQPANGTVSLSGQSATYFSFRGFAGTDTFTYAAWDGSIDSNLATVTVTVTAPACTVTSTASAPATATAGSAVNFTASASAVDCAGAVAYDWNFGDGSPHASTRNASHVYASAGTFTWTMTATADGVGSVRSGSIVVSASSAPAITRVRSLSNPFAIEITGTGFQTGVKVFLGSDTTAWPSTQRTSSTRLVLTGSTLESWFPPRTAVAIKVVNPDGGSATTTYTRRR